MCQAGEYAVAAGPRIAIRRLSPLHTSTGPEEHAIKVDRRLLAIVLVPAAVWWTLTLSRGCQGGTPLPAEGIPTEQRNSGE
jgi:hypothetical protein